MKEKFKKVKEKIVNKLKNKKHVKKVIPVILVAIILISLGLLLFTMLRVNKKVTDLEKIKIEEVSDSIMKYMEYIENTDSKEIDKYVIYALKKAENEENKKELTIEEIKNIIENNFNKKITKEQIATLSITPEMVGYNIVYDIDTSKYKIEEVKKSYAEIAQEEIIQYEIKEIKKKKKNIYEVEYEKYKVENPYEILNNQTEENKDTKEINEYLKGQKNKAEIKKYITKKNINKIGKKEKEIKVIYELKNKNLLINEIESVK